MSRDTVLLRGRGRAEQEFTDVCTIQHQTNVSTNTTTGNATKTYSTVYTGPCKVRGGTPGGQELAGAHLAVLSPAVHVPITVTGVVEGDVITVTASRFDPELVGRVLRVQGPHHESAITARRLQCTEVTS